MPPRSRAAAKPLSLGFAGSGELDAKALTALLDDLVGDSEIEALYVPVTKDDYSEEIAAVVAWAVANELPYITISDEGSSKDRALKKVIADADGDYDAGDSAGKAIVELLSGSETEPVADGRLLMFFDGEEPEDVAVFEEAHDLEVAAFDLRDGLSPLRFGDEEPAPADEPDPEPEETPAPRGRRGRKPAQEPEPEGGGDAPTEDELMALPLTELKKRAKAMDPKNITTETLRGLQKPDVIAILTATGEEGADAPADEAQTEAPARRRRGAAAAAEEPADAPASDDEADSRELVFQRLQGQREAAERITRTLTKVSAELIDAASEEGGDEAAFETAAAIVASALMIFADFIVTEVRKPKSAGRPRKDGTEAQPKPPAPVKTTRRARRSAAAE